MTTPGKATALYRAALCVDIHWSMQTLPEFHKAIEQLRIRMEEHSAKECRVMDHAEAMRGLLERWSEIHPMCNHGMRVAHSTKSRYVACKTRALLAQIDGGGADATT